MKVRELSHLPSAGQAGGIVWRAETRSVPHLTDPVRPRELETPVHPAEPDFFRVVLSLRERSCLLLWWHRRPACVSQTDPD
jgi:hypothetical protein